MLVLTIATTLLLSTVARCQDVSNPVRDDNSPFNRILQLLGFKNPQPQQQQHHIGDPNGPQNSHSLCPYDAPAYVKNTYGRTFDDTYLKCDPKDISGCPQYFICDKSRQLQIHICCAMTSGGTERPPITAPTTQPPISWSPPSTTTPSGQQQWSTTWATFTASSPTPIAVSSWTPPTYPTDSTPHSPTGQPWDTSSVPNFLNPFNPTTFNPNPNGPQINLNGQNVYPNGQLINPGINPNGQLINPGNPNAQLVNPGINPNGQLVNPGVNPNGNQIGQPINPFIPGGPNIVDPMNPNGIGNPNVVNPINPFVPNGQNIVNPNGFGPNSVVNPNVPFNPNVLPNNTNLPVVNPNIPGGNVVVNPAIINPNPFPIQPNVISPSGIPQVLILSVGRATKTGNGDFDWASSMTLVKDEMKNILFDTGVPTDGSEIIRALARYQVTPDNIDLVVISHGHPDHFGNQNLFARKPQLFDYYEFLGNRFTETILKTAATRKLTANVEVWKTPGHTPQDISLIIRNVAGNGTIALVGDLIMSEDFVISPQSFPQEMSWNRNIQVENMNAVLCAADYIVPGHGQVFLVRPEYKLRANCAATKQQFPQQQQTFNPQPVYYPPYRNGNGF